MRDPLLETLPLSHPKRGWIERQLGVGRFQRVIAKPILPLGLCYWNVDAHVKEHGGEPVYGWLILQWPGLYVEALHHAVWRSPNGALVDITGKYATDRRPFSVFAPDASQEISLSVPVFIPNRYLPLTSAPAVTNLIRAAHEVLDHRRSVVSRLLREPRVEWRGAQGLAVPKDLTPVYAVELAEMEEHKERMSRAFIECAALRRS